METSSSDVLASAMRQTRVMSIFGKNEAVSTNFPVLARADLNLFRFPPYLFWLEDFEGPVTKPASSSEHIPLGGAALLQRP